MGREARCAGEFGGWNGVGRLLLETDDLIFRGETRLKVALCDIADARAEDGWLVVRHADGEARFELGEAAGKWADAIRNPRTLMDKLGVRPASRVAVLGVADPTFLEELYGRSAQVATFDAVAALAAEGSAYDLIVYGAETPDSLVALPVLKGMLVADGGVWVISPKQRPEIGRVPVIAAAKRSGLVDVKAARFSATHTALKLVIPKADRR